MTAAMVDFIEDYDLDSDVVDHIINDNSNSGMEILDYINSTVPMTEEQWAHMVDGQYEQIIISRDPVNKNKVFKALIKMLT